jgi:hypothetical protein
MAAGIVDHRWSMEELLTFTRAACGVTQVAGRKPLWLLEAERAV